MGIKGGEKMYRVRFVKLLDEATYESYSDVLEKIKEMRDKVETMYWIGHDEVILILSEEEGEEE
ncbi:hypothetical protein DRN93_00290 [archaeon]|nr:MAG: hypothetical protein DRN93_00290 [archaeon]